MLKQFIKSELNKILKTDYYGTDEQIKNEQFILNETQKLPFDGFGFEMKDRESIEEYYKRIYNGIQ